LAAHFALVAGVVGDDKPQCVGTNQIQRVPDRDNFASNRTRARGEVNPGVRIAALAQLQLKVLQVLIVDSG